MIERVVKVINRAGIHARPASMLVGLTKDFKSSVYFEQGQNRINAKSILGIITLGAMYNSEIKIIAEGEDEQEAVERLMRLFESKFEDEESASVQNTGNPEN
ncbi:MAG: HPr family phosphocarrier protein [Spirochaetaceae bacterium]|jgi:phosphocarrier protein|nr:HPr family phosphocarrier protein [Spirochaetaceae bacterium]